MYPSRCFRPILTLLLAGLFLFSAPFVTAAETIEETNPPEETEGIPETTLPEEEGTDVFFSAPCNLYFGLLHAHTNISDGLGTVEEAFSHAAGVEGLEFFAVTDHSNSFDNAGAGAITLDGSTVSQEWAAGKAAAAAVTNENFLGIFGYEMTWPEIRQLGHITTYNTPGWISRDQKGFADDPDALEHYLEALSTVPGSVSQFSHPGSQYGDFNRFRGYQAAFDESIQLIEVLGEGSLESYIRALDAGWHLAPTASQNNHNGRWGDENDLRTVVLAEELTEESLFEAIRQHRVYATEDKDLHICWDLDGHLMGSILSDPENPEVFVSLYDPTESGSCTVEVIAEGGVTLASDTAEGNSDLAIRVPGGYRWYFLRITQADGDMAVTAPVWVEDFENLGIAAFAADSPLPLQGQPLELSLTLYNEETVDAALTSLELYAGETLIYTEDTPNPIAPGSTLICTIPYTHPDIGTAVFRAVVRCAVPGRELTWEATLTLRFRPGEIVTGVLIDGSHGNAGLDQLTHLKALARENGMNATVFTGPMPLGGALLVIPPLSEMPEDSFSEDVARFLESGGSLILLGQEGNNRPGNRLLEEIGLSLRFGSEPVSEGSANVFRTESPWCRVLSENQFFRHGPGCSLELGSGTWLVRDDSGAPLLACEETPFGGTVFVSGCPFLLDSHMPEPKSLWTLPRANQTLLEAILGAKSKFLEQQPISQVRSSTPGELYRIRGYVTAGTADPNTTFPDTLYLQDDSGGIAVTGFSVPNIQISTPLEVMGILRTENGNPVLEYTDHRIENASYFYLSPQEYGCKNATDYASYGGQLMQVEGTVTQLTLTADGKGIARLVVKDIRGDTAIVEIDDAIRSGSTGLNTLAKTIKKGRTVRVIGLLHINEAGEPVLRVRDCDEVVYVPPKADPTNPKTADRRWWFR